VSSPPVLRIGRTRSGFIRSRCERCRFARNVRTTFRVERTLEAPAGAVWQVWNDADLIKQWWGPRGYSAPVIHNDLRVGGSYLWSMKSAEGRMFWNTGVYNEVEPNKKIVATMSFANQEGRAIPGAQAPVLGRWPDKIIVITEFSELNGHTRVAVTEVGIPLFVKVLSKIAWTQQFDKIQTLVESPAPSTGWAKDVALGSKYNGSATHKDRLKRGDP